MTKKGMFQVEDALDNAKELQDRLKALGCLFERADRFGVWPTVEAAQGILNCSCQLSESTIENLKEYLQGLDDVEDLEESGEQPRLCVGKNVVPFSRPARTNGTEEAPAKE